MRPYIQLIFFLFMFNSFIACKHREDASDGKPTAVGSSPQAAITKSIHNGQANYRTGRESGTPRCIKLENKIENYIKNNLKCEQTTDCMKVKFGPCGEYLNKNKFDSLRPMLDNYNQICESSIIAQCLNTDVKCSAGKCVRSRYLDEYGEAHDVQ